MSGQGQGQGGQGIYEKFSQTAASAAAAAQKYASSLTGQTSSSGSSTLPVGDSTPVAGAAAAAGVPETVAESDRKANWAPEAAASPEAVRQNSAMEDELARTVPRERPATAHSAGNDPVGLGGVAGDKSHSIDDSQHGVGAIAGLTGANAATTVNVPNGKISPEPYPYTMPVSGSKPESTIDSSATKAAGTAGTEPAGNYSCTQGGDDRLHPSGTEHSSTAIKGDLAPTDGVTEVRNNRDPTQRAIIGDNESLRNVTSSGGGSTAKKDVTSDTGDAPSDVKRNLQDLDDSSPKDDTTPKNDVAPKSNKPVSDKEAATRTNESAIPVAGGKKVGEGHFGESSQVPEVSPKKEGDPGSKITNTAQEISTGGDSSAKEKSSSGSKMGNVLHKVEDKLHIGKK